MIKYSTFREKLSMEILRTDFVNIAANFKKVEGGGGGYTHPHIPLLGTSWASTSTPFIIMTKNIFYLLYAILHALRRDYDKKQVFLFQHCVHYGLVKKEDILFFISAIFSLRLDHD